MLARVVTLRIDPLIKAFDDSPLREFLKAKEVFAICEHFFVRNEVPYLAVLVTYSLQPPVAGSAPPQEASAAIVKDTRQPFVDGIERCNITLPVCSPPQPFEFDPPLTQGHTFRPIVSALPVAVLDAHKRLNLRSQRLIYHPFLSTLISFVG